ncbi:MAG: glycosyltransferase [Wenzhouxiangella sp.]
MSRNGALVLVTSSFPISMDGSEAAGSFVSDLAEEIARHMPVKVVAPGSMSETENWHHGIEIFRYAAPKQALSTLDPRKPKDLVAILKVLAAGQTAAQQAVRAGPSSHILALWALPSGHWARRVSRQTAVPYSVWTLGSDIWSLGRIPVVRSQLRRVLRDANTCYSDGLMLAEDTRRIAGRPVEFLPSTRRIDRPRTAPLKSRPPYRLLFLGRWHPNKGVDLLIEALKLLNEDDWQRIEAVEICGGGPLDALVRSGAADLRTLGRPIEVRGYLDKASAEEAISRADYLMIPSRIESIPVVFSDAVKLGCPVLASPVGDLPRLISQSPKCGLVAKRVDPLAWSWLIKSALKAPASEFSRGLTTIARRFDLSAIALKLSKLSADQQKNNESEARKKP